jgi:hypothetical protein
MYELRQGTQANWPPCQLAINREDHLSTAYGRDPTTIASQVFGMVVIYTKIYDIISAKRAT